MNKNNTNKTYSIVPGSKMGVLSLESLEKLVAVARKHSIPLVKITSAQRLAIAGFAPEKAEEILQDLGQEGGPQKPPGIHYIQSCPGVKWCKYGKNVCGGVKSLGLKNLHVI